MLTLGVESSCDDMAAAVVRDGRDVLSSRVESQIDLHQPYGGVVPELASRDHARTVSQVVKAALDEAGVAPPELDGVAVTAGPGLVGSLLVGLSFAKALAYRLGIPVVGVHHLEGHLASAELADPSLTPPYIGLVISGGHTALYRIEADGPARLLGETRDDAVGEAFDKVARVLGLPFPGGPAVSHAAESGDPDAIAFPRPLAAREGFDFSYSGLKTAVALEVEKRRAPLAETEVADIAASFEAAAIAPLVSRSRAALRAEGLRRIAVVGGVAANRRLRSELARVARTEGFEATFPPLDLCTDNAAMIAAAGATLLKRGEAHGLDLNSFSRVPIGATPWTSSAPD
ncbi:MAG: tRNA (adenosine(37)-N6)-threonylcarbamoyltransferase complex transferase subunit TsaD [Deltaproteobacteria bacterium]|nr:tRNA (adenosine(37)-N6)-threonylcarbamoyltransferase complex transferase subunit TsaD [Myxococcales bacterium]TDJ13830.1 MAG: tRNA (adenosine(37)-N6)-threonylcarbamoyltransferase complex transferase subunit TsaD [Deltaproteobacteria bacterium]TDJ20505.1 MAG: tRNA (adenosine(37)-N6)-threonylcarbamoyltransferase complex transferase subunit TsaD [Deltaproteobacteria bacterium]